MWRWFWVLLGLLAVISAVGLGWLALLQSTEQTARLSLDLGGLLGAWQMADDVPVVILMAYSALAGGGALILAWLWWKVFRAIGGAPREDLGGIQPEDR